MISTHARFRSSIKSISYDHVDRRRLAQPWWGPISMAALLLACGDSTGESAGSVGSSTSTGAGPGTSSSTQGSGSGSGSGTSAADSTGAMGTTAVGSTRGESTDDTGTTGTVEPSEGSFWVFVSANQGVSTWSMDPETGDLTFERNQDLGTQTGALALDPTLSTLYVALLIEQRIDSFVIDPQTAELSSLGSADVQMRPVYIAIDDTGSYLMTATFGGDEMGIFPLAMDGSVQLPPTDRRDTPEEPHAILTDATNQWLFVPHRTPNLVAQFAFDASTGTVTPNGVPQVEPAPGQGPRHMVFHPDNDHAYVANEFGDSVSSYAFDPVTGQLTLQSTITTLPDDVPGDENTCADIHITPDGRFVYVSNRGYNSLAIFAVDPVTHELGAAGEAATEPRPREFDISPRGRYLFAAGQDSGMLASYTIDSRTGALQPGPIYDVGEDPRWVLTVELPPVE